METVEEEEGDWHEIRVLDNRVRRGEPLELTNDVRDLLKRTAPTVAIPESDAESALASVESGTALLHEIRRRITEGSNRLIDALHRMYQFRDRGDFDGARQQMRDVLAVEVVPLYRDVAVKEIEKLNRLSF
ncbi:DUSAM domain-containing protein [Archangium violaceum]|uniref:DUSAM domain-containing protein n=1 Tax=Archangium violaceum TaxID=83451 RepID=UPI00193BC243|nr:DUSAM domain-containing protein [Archangium violaceum]QRK06983.1 DUSAM domain-containing protein [Archangium violaceum]